MNRDNLGLMRVAYDAWASAAQFRAKRERHKRYTYGDQWCDIVHDGRNRAMREDSLIVLSGKRPVSNNLLRQLVKTIVGRYRTLQAERDGYGTLGADAVRNALPELDSRLLEEFLISGCAVQRIVAEARCRSDRAVWVENVDPRRLIVNRTSDPRGWDVELIGMLHDMSLPEVYRRFGRGKSARLAELHNIYTATSGDRAFAVPTGFGTLSPAGEAFFRAAEGRCRVVELWTLDCRHRKADFDFVWHCRWLAPDGTVLDEYDSPYAHGEHPFAMKFYPLTDGEVHPFIEDVIDQQRYINRLLVIIDHMMAASAKGVLLFPTDQLPRGFSWDEVADRWAHVDGIIPITGKGMHLPQQVVSPMADSGVYRLLELQMKLFEDASGVTDAMMGRKPTAGTGVELYESQLRNATMALTDLLATFDSFTEARNQKILQSRN